MKKLKLLMIPLLIAMLLFCGMNSFAELHSKWSAGDLIFYDGTTNIWAIRNGTDGVKVYDDLNLTFGTDNDATIKYDEDSTDKLIITCSNGFTFAGDLGFTGDILMATTSKIQFHDALVNIYAADDGDMVINADATLIITSPTTEIVCTTGTIDAATSISLEAGAGTYGFSATTFDVGTLTITNVGTITATNAAGPTVINLAATATVPTLCPNRAETDTGIGWQSDVLHVVLGGVDEYNFAGTAFSTSTSDGAALGTSSLMWSDLFLANLGVIDFNNDITLTHASNLLTFAGGNFRMGTTDRIEFRDATEYIHSLNDGYIDLVAVTGFRIDSEVLVGENSAGHGFTLYGESSGSYLDWQGAEGDSLDLVNSVLTVTNATAATGVHSAVTGSVAYTGWALGFYGQAIISNPAGNAANAAGGVFEVNVTAEHEGGKTGIWAGIYAGAFANSTTGGQLPTAGIVVETIIGATIDGSTVPLMTLMTSGAGTESKYLLELGNVEAGKTVTTNTDADACMIRTGGNAATNIVLTQGIQIIVNDADYYIPIIAIGDWVND